jgi:hypothetical protein
MHAPKCRTCGQRHWSRLCQDVTEDVTSVTETVTSVAKPVTVTPAVTPRLVAPSKLAALQTENDALRAEVAMLKRKLAEVNRLPTTSAERMRRMREKHKQA